MTLPETPRGIRNHNPGNLRRLPIAAWLGMAAVQRDPAFIEFDGPEWGIRALCRVLLTYRRRHGLRTVREIITRWAPPQENDTEAYIRHVAKALRVAPDEPVDVTKPEILAALAAEIIRHENGQQPYSRELIARAVDMALA